MKRCVLLLFLLLLAGCTAQGPAEDGRYHRIGFMNLADSDPNSFACQQAFRQAVEEAGEIEVICADSDEDSAQQIANVENLLVRGVDQMFLIGDDPDTNAVCVRACNRAGVPVFLVATQASGGEYSFIGFDETEFGRKQALWCLENLPEGAGVCYMNGTAGRITVSQREQSFMDTIAQREDIRILNVQAGDFKTETAMRVTEDWIQRFGSQMTCIVAQDNKMIAGAIEALRAADMTGSVRVVGVIVPGTWDAQLVADGKMDYGVYVDFQELGRLAARVALQCDRGQETARDSYIPIYGITQENYSLHFPKKEDSPWRYGF